MLLIFIPSTLTGHPNFGGRSLARKSTPGLHFPAGKYCTLPLLPSKILDITQILRVEIKVMYQHTW